MEAMAPAIGIPAATNPPKTNTMTMNDKGRAIPSPACRSVSIWWVMASTSGPTPPTEPVAPGNAATMASNCCCAAAWAAVRCAVVRSFANDATVTKPPPAGLPPLRNAAASGFWRPPGSRNGDVTELTPGTAARFSGRGRRRRDGGRVGQVRAGDLQGEASSELAWLSSTRSWPVCASLGADGAPECRRWNSDSPVTPPTATAKAATVMTTQTSTTATGAGR